MSSATPGQAPSAARDGFLALVRRTPPPENDSPPEAGQQPRAQGTEQEATETIAQGEAIVKPQPDDTLLIEYSTFSSVNAAGVIKRHKVPWRDLVRTLTEQVPVHAAKVDCGLLKLAAFGTTRNRTGSLRHDSNVIALSGVEGDYDGGEVPLDEAARRLQACGLEAVLYTSPSHTPQAPRWRVLAPLSKPHAPEHQCRLVSLVNGALGGILAVESWSLSQTYYFGRLRGKPYETRWVRGDCVDQLDLVITPIGKAHRTAVAAADLPELLTAEALPNLAALGLPEAALDLLAGRREPEDRSRALTAATAALYEATRESAAAPRDSVVLSLLWSSAWVRDYATEKRRGDEEAALDYLWRYHCLKQRGKAASAAEDFVDISGGSAPGEPPLHAFYAYLPEHKYLHRATRRLWPAGSVDGHLRIKIGDLRASQWLDRYRAVKQMTWSPGDPELIEGRIAADGGWIEQRDALVYNLYRGPTIVPGDQRAAQKWLDHVHAIYPNEAEHLIAWLAHRVQRPGEKINHALVAGGEQGVGKDTLFEPVKRAVGPWNWSEISPAQMMGGFNGFVKSVVVRVSEARDLGEVDRFTFYDHSKTYIAAPPDVLMCNEKYIAAHPVPNVMGVLITTNHRTDGIYLPADDRRHFVAWSPRSKSDFDESYWRRLWGWLDSGGDAHVADYLRQFDLRMFNPKAPPVKTEAFHAIVAAGSDPQDVELGALLDRIGRPAAVTIEELAQAAAVDDLAGESWVDLTNPKGRRRVPHRMERAGYLQVRNPDADSGLWNIDGRRQMVYGRKELPLRDQLQAARAKCKKSHVAGAAG